MIDREAKGRADYEAHCAAEPTYHDGTPRRRWDQLCETVKGSWMKPGRPDWK